MDSNMVELLKTENIAFKRKLQSKSEALHILQTQLMNLQHELDHQRSRSRNNTSSQQNYSPSQPNYFFNDNGSQQPSKNNLEIINRKLMDENKLLMFDIEDLKQKLNDTNNDLTMLRKQQIMMRNSNHVVEKVPTNPTSLEHLEQLEHLNRKYLQLEQDLQILLDEKQDLIKQRDIYYDKMQRLNIQIKNLLNISNKNVDFDAIVMENKYLKQRLEDVLNEKKLWNKTVTKYKTMLNNNCQNTGKILSYDQIAKHINSMTSSIALTKQKQPPQDQTNLKQICITLLETLTEKNLLLQHQRKTNKLLATRILEIEQQNGPHVNTCDILLRGYSATGGDTDIMVDIEDEKMHRDVNETENKNVNIHKTSDTQVNGKNEDITTETIKKSMKEQDNENIDRQKEQDDDDAEHEIIVGYNLIDSHEDNLIIVNNHGNVNNNDRIENVKIMGDIVHSIGDTTADILDNSENGAKEKCKEQIENDINKENNKTVDSIERGNISSVTSPLVHHNGHDKVNDINKTVDSNEQRGIISVTSPQVHHNGHDTVNNKMIQETRKDEMIQETKDLNENISFEDHDDIQSLPLELQKLVLQAMKDLEQDEIKSV